MKSHFINLKEENFPIRIKKRLKNLNNIRQLGKIKEYIEANLEIEKLSKEHFSTKGSVSVSIESECQRCFKKTDINLNLEIKVGIKDNNYIDSDEKELLEIHYQDLNKFDIDSLISEEINLNYPSVVICCDIDNIEPESNEIIKKTQPFKKIRDLIK